jgi:hypothetical protein
MLAVTTNELTLYHGDQQLIVFQTVYFYIHYDFYDLHAIN